MRINVWSLVILVLFATNNLRAEGPGLAKVNRFFGLGWGDGYHVGWNDWAGCSGCSAGCVGCQPTVDHDPKNQVRLPTPKPVPEPSASDVQSKYSGNARSQIVLFKQPERREVLASLPAIVIPRLVRLPPVVEKPQVSLKPSHASPLPISGR